MIPQMPFNFSCLSLHSLPPSLSPNLIRPTSIPISPLSTSKFSYFPFQITLVTLLFINHFSIIFMSCYLNLDYPPKEKKGSVFFTYLDHIT